MAGIVGSMAIEYDFDPEDDLIQEGDRSLDFRYQTKAVVAACINTGEITGKQDYTGGIVGLMDLGRVGNCENYGAVFSSNGDYSSAATATTWGALPVPPGAASGTAGASVTCPAGTMWAAWQAWGPPW